MNFYNVDNNHIADINYPDIYFTPEYGRACEYSDNAEWEVCKFKDLIYVYLKQPIDIEGTTYYDLITPYGYSGFYYTKEDTYIEFIPIFREKAKERNYITEVVRQNPYLDIQITEYEKITTKHIYGIETRDFEQYFNSNLHKSKRNKYKKAQKINLSYKLIHDVPEEISQNIIELYNKHMKRLNAEEYYYFNEQYFNSLLKLQNSYLAMVLNVDGEIVGSSIILKYNNNIHYHLSCNDNSSSCITDFLLVNTVKEMCMNKLFILGGGLTNGDGLSIFKQNFSNKEFEYNIYKNILNHKIYDKLNETHTKKETNFFPIHRDK